MTAAEQKEQKAIEYLSAQIDFSQPEVVLRIYRQILEQNLFSTEIGREYINKLRQFLMDHPAVDNELIPGAPSREAMERAREVEAEKRLEEELRHKAAEREKRIESGTPLTPAEETEKLRRDTKKLVGRYRQRMRTMTVITAIAVVMVIAMFIITLTSNLPTIINYRRVITDQYEQWEQELNEREADLEAYEKRLKEMAARLGKDSYEDSSIDTSDLAPIDDKLFELKDANE